MSRFAVTTVKNNACAVLEKAKKWSEELQLPFVERKGGTLDSLMQANGLAGLIIAGAEGAELYSASGRLFFHPGMSVLRIAGIMAGKSDRLVNAMQLKQGMSVLDCTLGMAADAIVASFVAGDEGSVTALEAVMPLWFVMTQGLGHYEAEEEYVTKAMRRIKTVNEDFACYLKNAKSGSFDIIYFDPMFEYSIKGAGGIAALKAVADNSPFDISVIWEAQRVARERVVVKLAASSKMFSGCDADYTNDGRYSNVKYAVFEAVK